jgi:phosphate transport system permease protein
MGALEAVIFKDDPNHIFNGGANLLSAVIVLAIMILPTIVNVSETALRAVPRDYKEASLALGASHIQTIFKVMIGAARSGIVTSIVLGIGRAIGEAMAIIMVAGNVANFPLPFNSVRFLTTAIVSDMSYASAGAHREALFGIGLVLFLFIMIINFLVNIGLKGNNKKEK